MTQPFVRNAALAGVAGSVVSLTTSLLVVARVMADDASATWNVLDLAGDLTMIIGLAGFATTRAAGGWLGRAGLTLAFAGLAAFTVAGVAGFASPVAGEALHPISVPLTGVGMLLTGVAVLRTRRWRGWIRYAPLACGLCPFVIELPGFITFGDSPNLHAFIACTTASWLVFFIALSTTAEDRSTVPATA
jgi:hypothetical protein